MTPCLISQPTQETLLVINRQTVIYQKMEGNGLNYAHYITHIWMANYAHYIPLIIIVNFTYPWLVWYIENCISVLMFLYFFICYFFIKLYICILVQHNIPLNMNEIIATGLKAINNQQSINLCVQYNTNLQWSNYLSLKVFVSSEVHLWERHTGNDNFTETYTALDSEKLLPLLLTIPRPTILSFGTCVYFLFHLNFRSAHAQKGIYK